MSIEEHIAPRTQLGLMGCEEGFGTKVGQKTNLARNMGVGPSLVGQTHFGQRRDLALISVVIMSLSELAGNRTSRDHRVTLESDVKGSRPPQSQPKLGSYLAQVTSTEEFYD